ncbi:MAG: M48 family peptidase [Gammaproteobacteria bacterium]|nr:MAG: M48 family peptidase [Gammaproteobacteria bacterium]
MKYYKYTLGIVLLLLISSCATSPTGRSQFMLVSEETAIHSSKEAYVKMLQPLSDDGKLDNDPVVKQRVINITERLIAQAIKIRPETAKWDWEVKVIDDPNVVNAWCMAGGKMAVYTGLINKIEPTDDELAQVMGHEISHALANHQAEKMSISMIATAGVIAAGIVSDRPALAMTGAALAASLAITKPNSRTAETEADRIGIEIAAKAGYNPNAAVSLWKKMAEVSGEGPPQFLSTHPAPANRSSALAALIPEMMPYYEQAKAGEPEIYKLK